MNLLLASFEIESERESVHSPLIPLGRLVVVVGGGSVGMVDTYIQEGSFEDFSQSMQDRVHRRTRFAFNDKEGRTESERVW